MTSRPGVSARPAAADDVREICRICAEGWRDTYAELLSAAEIERVIAQFYSPERVARELSPSDDGTSWQGYLVAVDATGGIVAAGGGGLVAPGIGELFVLYADPRRRREGAGRALLTAVTAQQTAVGAHEQWVSVHPSNRQGISFYEAMGFVTRGRQAAFESSDRESLRMWRAL